VLVTTTEKPAVLVNRYPVWDGAGNKLQQIRLRFICGHEEEYFSCDMGRGWKPRSDRQIARDELRITCPIGWKLCRACSETAS
jgi:hypothetical protein